MAETYETSIYGKPQAQQTGGPTQPQQAGGQPQSKEQYETPIYRQQPTASQQTGQQPTGGGQQTSPAQPPQGWGIDWSRPGGEVTMPQSVQDFGNVAGSEAWMGLPGLRAEAAAAARQRLGPMGAGAADFVGSALSPTQLLNAVPVVGPELAGAAHEGIKSYMAGNDWKTIGEDAAGGAGFGLLGQGTAAAAKYALPQVIKGGVMTGAGYLGHKVLGGAALGDFGKELPGIMGLYKMMDDAADWAGRKGEAFAAAPATQQAIKSLILGGGSAFRQGTGPYDQWIPGQ